jgi:DNA-binding winged helix-turn-helix (wHTH) protein
VASPGVDASLLHFGQFALDVREARLSEAGRRIDLAPRDFAVLAFLAANAGRLVTKDELLDAVWRHRFVSQSVLKAVVSRLRGSLRDTAGQPRYIETVTRRGYRFVARVTASPPPPPTAEPAAPRRPAGGGLLTAASDGSASDGSASAGSGLVLDERAASVLRNGDPVALAPKAFEVLRFLARRPGRLVTKHELLDGVWGRRFITEGVIKTVMSELRAALGDDPRAPRWIETIPRRGYRFIGQDGEPRSPGRARLRIPRRRDSTAN